MFRHATTVLGLVTLLAVGHEARGEAYVNIGGGGMFQQQTQPVFAQVSGGVHDSSFDIEAQSYAHLATGSMGLKFAYTPYVPVLGQAGVSAESTLRDSLKLTGPGNALVPVTFTVQVDALLHFASLQASQGGVLHFVVEVGFGGMNGRLLEVHRQKVKDANGDVVVDTVDCWGECNSFNTPLTTAGVIDSTVQFTALLGQDFFHNFQARVSGWANAAIDAVVVIDALNTVQLGVSVPASYTLTSASGVFLTQPVPEPSTWMLLLGGAALLRRRLISG